MKEKTLSDQHSLNRKELISELDGRSDEVSKNVAKGERLSPGAKVDCLISPPPPPVGLASCGAGRLRQQRSERDHRYESWFQDWDAMPRQPTPAMMRTPVNPTFPRPNRRIPPDGCCLLAHIT